MSIFTTTLQSLQPRKQVKSESGYRSRSDLRQLVWWYIMPSSEMSAGTKVERSIPFDSTFLCACTHICISLSGFSPHQKPLWASVEERECLIPRLTETLREICSCCDEGCPWRVTGVKYDLVSRIMEHSNKCHVIVGKESRRWTELLWKRSSETSILYQQVEVSKTWKSGFRGLAKRSGFHRVIWVKKPKTQLRVILDWLRISCCFLLSLTAL